jgi:hypothetical protein
MGIEPTRYFEIANIFRCLRQCRCFAGRELCLLRIERLYVYED